MRPNSVSVSSVAVVSSTSRICFSRATSVSSSSAISISSPARPFSAIRRRKLTTSSSAPAAICARTSPFVVDSISGFASRERSSSTDATASRSCCTWAWTRSSLFLSSAASNSARA
jgi:hypothetical protein